MDSDLLGSSARGCEVHLDHWGAFLRGLGYESLEFRTSVFYSYGLWTVILLGAGRIIVRISTEIGALTPKRTEVGSFVAGGNITESDMERILIALTDPVLIPTLVGITGVDAIIAHWAKNM